VDCEKSDVTVKVFVTFNIVVSNTNFWIWTQ